MIHNILTNWDELHAYFTCAELDCDQSAKFKARMIKQMLADTVNFLYFTFLAPVVTEFERVNAFFQTTSVDPDKLDMELSAHHRSLINRFFDTLGNERSLERVDFEAKFLAELNICAETTGNAELINFNAVKDRCHQFLIECMKQVETRLPATKHMF